MKKIISVILVCSMLLLGSVTVFATETEADTKNYNLSELFNDYQEKNLSEMVEFISANPWAYYFPEVFKVDFQKPLHTSTIFIHTTTELTRPNNSIHLETFGFSLDKCSDYLMRSGRVTAPDVSEYDPLVGEVGTKVMSIELNKEFLSYVNSLGRVEANKLILNFLMNMLSDEDVVGISWDDSAFAFIGAYQAVMIGDCNGDGMINGADGYLMKIALAGYVNNNVDPFAVDIDGDGLITSKDSLLLKRKIAIG